MAGTTDQPGSPEEKVPTLRRKLSSARSARPGGQRRSLAWALRLSVAKCAADLCGLPLAAIDANQSNEGPDGLSEHLRDEGLLVLLDGPNGQTGAVCLDGRTVTALIQQQTLGKVLDPGDIDGPLTNTDAAMVAPMIDRTLQQATERLEAERDRQIIEGYRFGARVGNVRTLLLALSHEDYRVLELTLDISLGQAQGRLCILLPELQDPVEREDSVGTETSPGLSLQEATGVIRAELSAVVSRLTLPLTQLSQLTSGDLLVLPGSFSETELITIDGQLAARGQLGQASGARAVRLFGMRQPSGSSEQTPEEFSTQSTRPLQDGQPADGEAGTTKPAEESASKPAQPASQPAGDSMGAGAAAMEETGLEPGSDLQPEGAMQSGPTTATNSDSTGSGNEKESAGFTRNLPVPKSPDEPRYP